MSTLYGIGIGPGDPDLITLRALAVLRKSKVIAWPAPAAGESLARRIAAPHLPGDCEEYAIRIPMNAARFPAEEIYARAARDLGAHLAAGRDVAVLCEGDPFFYGSFVYLFARMQGAHRVEVVPGVSSLTACAAGLAAPLATAADVLSVVPATLPEPKLRAALGNCDAAAVIKIGRHLAKVRKALAATGLQQHARYIERATLPNQRIVPLSEVGDGDAPYFSMILIHRRGCAWL